MHKPDLLQKVAFLSSPATYTPRPRRVTAIETHFAWVFLAGSEAYKLKKPLRHMSMDYRTLARRGHGCREEVRLNRRLAPAVYRGVVPLTMDRRGQPQLAGAGPRIDWLVRMRRLQSHQMLDATLRRRPLRAPEMTALLATLGRFYSTAPRQPLRPARYLSRLRREIAENRSALLGKIPRERPLIEELVASQRAALVGLRPEINARATCVREGHGDLRPEHVCLRQPVAIIDCLEFNGGLRRLDPLEEVAFLALEITRLGRAGCARKLLRGFLGQSGPSASDALVNFYMCHRAMIRAKIAAWHIGDPQFPDPRPWRRRARSYLLDARRHAMRTQRAIERAGRQPSGGQLSSSGVSGR